jgi:type IV pilus assembly protein PilB
VEAASFTWRPLGRLLVEQGLLSHEELVTAIDEQEQTGRRLGEILVERGYVSASALAAALAEQFGIKLSAGDTETAPASGGLREVRRPILRVVPFDDDGEETIIEEPMIVEVPLEEPLSAFGYQRVRLVEARRELAARDRRIAELEAALARATSS